MMPWAKPNKAAEYFGDVSRRTIYTWLELGMPSVKIGNTRLIDLDAAERWLRDNFAAGTDTAAVVDELLRGLK